MYQTIYVRHFILFPLTVCHSDANLSLYTASLLDLNGVGPKMSILYLQAIGQNVGIGVDVHVARISNRLGWHKPGTEEPEKVRLNLESWLPKEYHREINKMLVGFGSSHFALSLIRVPSAVC